MHKIKNKTYELKSQLNSTQVDQFTQQPELGMLRIKRMENTHVRICDLCGYSTAKASSLKGHKMIHTGEKP